MKLEYKKYDSLPPLSWLAIILNGTCTVFHGRNVETKHSFFVEGAWSEDFSKGGFVRSEWFCGTGGMANEKEITFSTPTHVTAGVFACVNSGGGTSI